MTSTRSPDPGRARIPQRTLRTDRWWLGSTIGRRPPDTPIVPNIRRPADEDE